MDELLPDRLKTLWQAVEHEQLSIDAFSQEEARLLARHRRIWEEALRLPDYPDLAASLLAELASYTGCADLAAIERRCLQAVATLKREWQERVDAADRRSVEHFYDASQATLYELMWWHTLRDDTSPLAYVTALHFARGHGCERYLDFGSGVGSGSILFARHGFAVTLADISLSLLTFGRWRFERRRLPAAYIDLKVRRLPSHAFDFVTAMDVFEHLVDPVEVVDRLWDAVAPGGFLYARLNGDSDEDRPQHIVKDFRPTLERMRTLGFLPVWSDEWLWGHQVFQKPSRASTFR